LTEAQSQLEQARQLNPLNTDHTANLARLNRRWAELATDPAQRAEHTAIANDYYVQAVSLSPNNAGLWNEWAALALQVNDDPAAAQQYLDRSFALDSLFDQTYQLQGEVYAAQARKGTTPEEQQAWYAKAIEIYRKGIEVAEARGLSTTNLIINLASTYAALGQPQAAIDEYQRLLAAGAPGVDPWRVHLAISELYAQVGNMAQARGSAQTALELAPEADKSGVQAWLERIP
jgi:tetratricopeptide (TPR) repeat protein